MHSRQSLGSAGRPRYQTAAARRIPRGIRLAPRHTSIRPDRAAADRAAQDERVRPLLKKLSGLIGSGNLRLMLLRGTRFQVLERSSHGSKRCCDDGDSWTSHERPQLFVQQTTLVNGGHRAGEMEEAGDRADHGLLFGKKKAARRGGTAVRSRARARHAFSVFH